MPVSSSDLNISVMFCLFCKWKQSLQLKQPREGQFKKCDTCCSREAFPCLSSLSEPIFPNLLFALDHPSYPLEGSRQCTSSHRYMQDLLPPQGKERRSQARLRPAGNLPPVHWACTQPRDSDEQNPWISGCCRDPPAMRG